MMPSGMLNMFATTWSNPHATKTQIGIQIATIFESVSFAPAACHTATHTSQLQPMPRMKICVNVGSAAFLSAADWAYAMYGPEARMAESARGVRMCAVGTAAGGDGVVEYSGAAWKRKMSGE
jgi:hypothetical protein